MINFNKICVYDFETDSANPKSCNPVQLAAVMVNPRTLELIHDSEFNTMMRPLDFDEPDYFDKNKSTIEWHAKIRKCNTDDIMELWDKAPQQKEAFGTFTNYLLKYHTRTQRKNKFSAPVKAGYNIVRFDNIIIDRLAESYGNTDDRGEADIFHPRDQFDGMMMAYNWWENTEEPKKLNMDAVRDFLGMSGDNAHDALQDVRDTAKLITRFLKLHRKYAPLIKFKGAFK